MKLRLARSTARSYFDCASVRFARACWTSAALMDGSSRTSVAPFATRSPSLNMMSVMRPATSGRSVTDSSERRLPTAVMTCGTGAVPTRVDSTATAGACPPGPPGPPGAPAADLPPAGDAPGPPAAPALAPGGGAALRSAPYQ